MRSRIMYIEDKSGGLTGPCRIGRVTFSKTGATLYYASGSFMRVSGYKTNHLEIETGRYFWISGPRRDGADGLYGRLTQPEDVDDDVRDVYWREIRGLKAPATASGDHLVEAFVQAARKSGVVPVTGGGRKHTRVAAMLRQRQAAARAG